jgi:hypothetical protein
LNENANWSTKLVSSRDSFMLAKTRRLKENVCSINSRESALQTSFHKRPAEKADGAMFLCLIGFAAFPLGWKPEPRSQQILLYCILNLSLLHVCMIGFSGGDKRKCTGCSGFSVVSRDQGSRVEIESASNDC